MEKMPLLSIIIPVYNAEKYVRKCLDSVLKQSYKNIEIIIVNDGSKGNIIEIADEYMHNYTNIKLVNHKQNEGLFHTRITGVENSKGEYIAFLDSDDSVTIDFYRKMIQKAEETGSDMVACDYLNEYEDGSYSYSNYNNLLLSDIDLKGEDILKTLFMQDGLDYSWHVVWNKVYSRLLWNKCYPYLKRQTKSLTMCEDVAFSITFYRFAKHFTNVHNDYYLYLQNGQSSTKNTTSESGILKKLEDINTAFLFAEYLLKETGCCERYQKSLKDWKLILLKSWKDIISNASSPLYVKKRLNSKLTELNHGVAVPNMCKDDYFFYSVTTRCTHSYLQDIKESIANPKCKYVSFDIFDTLISRPFWKPQDLFSLMNSFVSSLLNITDQMDFCKMRTESERIAREKKRLDYPALQEVTLDEIYAEMEKTYHIEHNILGQIKQKEIEVELKYCNVRKIGQELYEYSLEVGKKVICNSDMYLPLDIIKKILFKNGYKDFYKIYVSSEIMLTKYDGDMYKYIVNDLKEPNAKSFIHIGDDWNSDVIMARKSGWTAFHLSKATDIFSNRNPGIFSGNYYHEIFDHTFGNIASGTALNFIGIRCMLAVIANKIFDNPFVWFNGNSDFNANPYFIGYFTVGMHMFAISKWLIENQQKENYDSIHFMARDGYLPKYAFEILNTVYKENVKTDYIYLSRKAILPLMIHNSIDFSTLINSINITSQSPKKFIILLKNLISSDKLINAEQKLKKVGFPYEKNFKSVYEYQKFITVFIKYFYDEENFKLYRQKLKEYFNPIFTGKNATFDVGYSARIESILIKNFGYDITPYYIHINGNLAYERSSNTKMKIKTLYDFAPAVTGVVREQIMSELFPSCIGYDYKKEKAEPMFEDYQTNYQTYFMVTTIQKGALDFVRDMVNLFGEDIKLLTCRKYDACIPFEYLLHYSKKFDRQIFSSSYFEDDLGEGKNKMEMTDFWNRQTDGMCNINNSLMWSSYGIDNISPKWKKFICLAMFDRKTMKDKVKKKYAAHPILLKIMKICYSIPRSIKHLVDHKK